MNGDYSKVKIETDSKVLYPDLSYDIMGVAMHVHNKLGPGWDEAAYHMALLHALQLKGLRAASKPRGVLTHRDLTAAQFEMDILVEDLIILELKHLHDDLVSVHYKKPQVNVEFEDMLIGLREVGAFSYNSVALVYITALSEDSSKVDLTRMQSYLRQSDFNAGIIANFGKKNLELRVVMKG